jgi:hypothetical protein
LFTVSVYRFPCDARNLTQTCRSDHYVAPVCRDATDVMYAFHSDTAVGMLQKLPRARGAEAAEPDAQTVAFRQLRERLVSEGWFKREWPVSHASFVQIRNKYRIFGV